MKDFITQPINNGRVNLHKGRDSQRPQNTTQYQYVLDLKRELAEIHDYIRQYTNVAAEIMKRNYDKKTNFVPFKEGDCVWLNNPIRKKGKSQKLLPKWTGPWMIVNIINDIVARIEEVNKPGNTQIDHIDRLAKFHKPTRVQTRDVRWAASARAHAPAA